MNNPPRPDLVGAPFIVKVDRGYEVIIFQLKPDLSEEHIQLTLDTPHYGTDEEKKKWYSIGTIKDYMPINIQKHRLTKI